MSPLHRRVLGIAAAAVCLVAVAACGDKATPNADPSASGQGQLGGASATPTTDATTPSPTTASTNGGGGGTQSPYPSSAKDYGLAILAAIKAGDDTRIVDLASLSVANDPNMSSFYKTVNGSWSYVDCASGSPQQCHYFNQTGTFATIGVDASKLGKAHAVSYVQMEGGSYPTDVMGYVSAFINYWENGSNVGKHAYAVNSVVSFVNGRTVPTTTTFSATVACGSGKTCVASGTETAGGQPFGQITCYTVQNNLLGKPQAIVGAKDGLC